MVAFLIQVLSGVACAIDFVVLGDFEGMTAIAAVPYSRATAFITLSLSLSSQSSMA